MDKASFVGTDIDAARAFSSRWLDSWTGDDPQRLVSFYADDALYLDPVVPEGLRGREALLAYFTKLLAYNPRWEWRQTEAIPMAGGFVNRFHATIHVGFSTFEARGVCLVWFAGDTDLVCRNEVYFDRTEIHEAIEEHRRKKRGEEPDR